MLLYSDTPMSPLARMSMHVRYILQSSRLASGQSYYMPIRVSGPARSERKVKVSDHAPLVAPDLTLYE